MSPSRGFYKREDRVFCRCELCCLRFGRLLYRRNSSGPALGMGRDGWSEYKHAYPVSRWGGHRTRFPPKERVYE
jgi:hypothetical protein